MAFRSLVLVSLLAIGGTAHSSARAAAEPDAISVVNAALAKQKLALMDGVPVLEMR